MAYVLIVVWLAYTAPVGQTPRVWEEITMQEFSSKESCEAAEATARKMAPSAGTACVKK